MRAAVAAIDPHIADAGGTHFAEGDFLQVDRHRITASSMASAGIRAVNNPRISEAFRVAGRRDRHMMPPM